MAEEKPINVPFELIGDDFPHAWFFNRFRVDKIGESVMVTFGLLTEGGGLPDVNAAVLSESDLQNNRPRAVSFLERVGEIAPKSNPSLGFTAPPKRVYPVNHINFSRINNSSEIGFFRFSVSTLVDRLRELRENSAARPAAVKCYPAVMFRCDLDVQVALIKELFAKR